MNIKKIFSGFALFFTLAAFSNLTACGGGGNGGGDLADPLGDVQTFVLGSDEVGVSYEIRVATPLQYDGSGDPRAAVFVLDGDVHFDRFRQGFYEDGVDVIIVGIYNSDRRNTDYMSNNNCTSDGGGQVAFLQFMVLELLPYLDENFNIDPAARVLFGHSHAGSFVFYTLFKDHGENFCYLLSTDASIGCASSYFDHLEAVYYSDHTSLPVTLYAAGAKDYNARYAEPFMQNLMARDHQEFIAAYKEFNTTHDGILNVALSPGFDWLASQADQTAVVDLPGLSYQF